MKQLTNILFIDIETVSIQAEHSQLSDVMKEQWARKAVIYQSRKETVTDVVQLFEEKAAIFAEFGKVVCIGLGCFMQEKNETKFVMKYFVDHDEKSLLFKFLEALERYSSIHTSLSFCGHNIKEFDLPYLCRRMMIHGIELPKALQLHGIKPWENPHIDTLELWRFGDFKHYISLALLAEVLGIPSPKDDIDGSMVSGVYWNQKDLNRIGNYCLKDVSTTAKIYIKLKCIDFNDYEIEVLD